MAQQSWPLEFSWLWPSLLPGPDWAILPLWGRILFRFHSRVVSKVGGSSVCMGWGMGSKENGGWAGLSGSQPRW